jgi:hypothetical protein
MMTSPESHARHVLSTIAKDAGPAAVEPGLLQRLIALIADEILKAVYEDRDELKEKMKCDPRDPCGFQNVCPYHRALAGAILSAPLAHH